MEVWAEPFFDYTHKYRSLSAYRRTRDTFGQDLRRLCDSILRVLQGQQAPTDKLRQVAVTLVSWQRTHRWQCLKPMLAFALLKLTERDIVGCSKDAHLSMQPSNMYICRSRWRTVCSIPN